MVEWQHFMRKITLYGCPRWRWWVEKLAGGDGGGFNLAGEDGFGRRSGKGGANAQVQVLKMFSLSILDKGVVH